MKLESKPSTSNTDSLKSPSLKEKIMRLTKNRVMVAALSLASMTAAYSHFKTKDYSEFQTFNTAFKKARSDGEKTFTWNGNKYTTRLVDKEVSIIYQESKKFLEEYYNSDYFKVKYPIDKLLISTDLMLELKENERYKYLLSKEQKDRLTPEEMEEMEDLESFYYDLSGKERQKEVARRISDKKSLAAQERIANLKKPTYFSITEQKGSMPEDGSYKKKDEKVFIYDRSNDKENTTSVHELTHKSTKTHDLFPILEVWFPLRERAVNSVNTMDDKSYSRHSKEFWEYLVNPTEIDARQNSTRFWLYKNFSGYRPDTVFERKHLDFLYHKYDNLPYDIKQLLELFPDFETFIDNMNKY